ncbi:hypothetical protein [Xenorhabdus bovienii]|uniref:Uncharacterized protein n=1 Tax=Xenorhabdus bovienii TaxID=40576 RepID=A0A0B6XER7_XENBV|nr:hypothetical protein [Xenorhabdus bovienii]CDM92065.1 conserved protein of unknown function [Xenorhabdus bovienii]
MKNTPHKNAVISATAESELLRVAQMTACFAELLNNSAGRHISSEGMAAVMECLSEKVELIIEESSLMNEDIK